MFAIQCIIHLKYDLKKMLGLKEIYIYKEFTQVYEKY